MDERKTAAAEEQARLAEQTPGQTRLTSGAGRAHTQHDVARVNGRRPTDSKESHIDMNRARQCCLIVTWLAAGVLTGTPLVAQELYMVVERDVDLYRDRRVAGRMFWGEIARGCVDEGHRDWLIVRPLAEEYRVRRRAFKTFGELVEERSRQIADREARMAELSQRLDANRIRVEELLSAMAAVRFDSVIQYRIRVTRALPVTPRTGTHPGRPGAKPHAGDVVLVPEYRYVDKIAPSQTSRLLRDWGREKHGLDEENEELETKLMDASGDKARAESALAWLRRVFGRYQTNPGGYLADTFVTIKDRTDLFEGRRLRYELRQGTAVLARPNRKHRKWLHVIHKGTVHDSRASCFRSREALEADFNARRERAVHRLRCLEHDILSLRNRERLLSALEISIAYESSVSRFPLSHTPIPPDSSARALYPLAPCPAGAVEVVQRSRARRLRRDWQRELATIREALDEQLRDQREIKRDMAGEEARHADLTRRLDELEHGSS